MPPTARAEPMLARLARDLPARDVLYNLRRSFVTLSRRSGLPESVVARFSGHRTATVFKRYNIVEEQDLKAAVAVLNRARKPGQETVTVDEECGQKHEGPAS